MFSVCYILSPRLHKQIESVTTFTFIDIYESSVMFI